MTRSAIMSLAVAGAAVLASNPAFAQDGWGNYYLGFYGGANWVDDADVSLLDDPIAGQRDATLDTGFAVGGVAGYAMLLESPYEAIAPLGLRLELDIVHRRNEVDTITAEIAGVGSGRTSEVSGDLNSTGVLVNFWLDHHLPGWSPYIGGGIGASRVSVNDLRIMGEEAADDSDIVFAFQLGLGAAFPIFERAELSADYRFFRTADPSFRDVAGERFDLEYTNHSAIIGLRYYF